MSVKQNNIFHSTVIDDKISVALFSIDGNTAYAGIDDRTFWCTCCKYQNVYSKHSNK